jgi:NAD(P)-dependent dehydrogenase (short-subunit alcohol dehydrogenase family)
VVNHEGKEDAMTTSEQPPVVWPGWVQPEGTVAIVTGAGSGIGQATTILAAQMGLKVAAWDINPAGIEATIARAGEYADSILPVVGNVGDEDAVRRSFEETVAGLGKPKLIVNNAGPTILGQRLPFDAAVQEAIASIHYVTEQFLALDPGPGGSVVNIAAVSGPIAGGTSNDPAGVGWYSAAKAGIAGYTKWCATEFARTARFNAIAPGGPIHTPRNNAVIDSPGMLERIARNPLRRAGTPEELAAGILFLWSPAASYVNGALLVIDGGLTLTGG